MKTSTQPVPIVEIPDLEAEDDKINDVSLVATKQLSVSTTRKI